MSTKQFTLNCRDCDSELEITLLNDENGAEDLIVCPVCGSDSIEVNSLDE